MKRLRVNVMPWVLSIFVCETGTVRAGGQIEFNISKSFGGIFVGLKKPKCKQLIFYQEGEKDGAKGEMVELWPYKSLTAILSLSVGRETSNVAEFFCPTFN